jgi:hypothetical protein
MTDLEQRFEELALLLDYYAIAVPDEAYHEFFRLWDKVFTEHPLTSKQSRWLDDFERRLCRVRDGGTWTYEVNERQAVMEFEET